MDGQQRLTTIRLILDFLFRGDDDARFSLSYERGEANSIDKHHIELAKENIKEWFRQQQKNNPSVRMTSEIERILTTYVTLIWYELSPEITQDECRRIFRNINAGKIPLTVSEITKAMLLNEKLYANAKGEQMYRASVWDEMAHAQGRIDTQATEIRNDFVSSLKNALETNDPLTLDCIYGSIKERSFIPTDGQQRLTSLFLLHYYISVAAKKLDSVLLNKFSYMVRDSAKEFCESLATHSIDLSTESPSLTIKNALWYHGGVFDNDPTIIGMLKMLDEIHVQFGTANALDYYEKLFEDESPIKFWWLSIDNFGFADDLFIKMNARGKSLTRFEMFKAEFETVITKSCNEALVQEWKEKIDNDWLELFWQYFGDNAPNNAESGLFRYIVFIGETFYSWQEKTTFVSKNISEDSDKIQYKNAITVFQNPNYFEFLCISLDSLEQLIKSGEFSNCKEFFKALVTGNSLDFWKYAKLFAVISYSVKFGVMDNFLPFGRVLNNLIAYQREINKRDMIFNTAIDGAFYHSFTKGIEELLVHMTTQYISPDHYSEDSDVQMIFDAKYYTKINGMNYKQISYMFMLREMKDSVTGLPKYRSTYSALILPSEHRDTKIHFQLALEFGSCTDLVITEEYIDIKEVILEYLS